MIATIFWQEQHFKIDFSKPLDISIPLSNTDQNPIAWYLEKPIIEPVKNGDWIGNVSKGNSSTNFNNIFFNPHGHGTHTECLGHITKDFFSINNCLKQFFFHTKLITVAPQNNDGDFIITKKNIENAIVATTKILSINDKNTSKNNLIASNLVLFDALVIRTFPNDSAKLSKKYSDTNPPFLSEDAAIYIREIGIKHLLIDLPSVDKERDEGKLLAHKAFWNVTNIHDLNADARLDATITELIFVDDKIPDGDYFLNIQIASFENDASPSKPVLYNIVVQ